MQSPVTIGQWKCLRCLRIDRPNVVAVVNQHPRIVVEPARKSVRRRWRRMIVQFIVKGNFQAPGKIRYRSGRGRNGFPRTRKVVKACDVFAGRRELTVAALSHLPKDEMTRTG